MSELKNLDTSVSAFQTTTWQVVNLTNFGTGTTANTRIGNDVHVKKISFLGGPLSPAIASPSVAQIHGQMRFLCVVDHQANGTTASGLDVMSFASPTSFINLSNEQRFTVLYDKFVNMCRNVTLDDYCFEVDLDLAVSWATGGSLPRTNAVLLLFINIDNLNNFSILGQARVLFSE